MIWNIGLAATQAAGIREMFGSMAKSFHPGRAAQNGYAGALLAQAGFTAGEHGLEGPRGFAAVQAAAYDLAKITAGLDTEYELRANTYKPFPCGIVNHPTIDGAIQLHERPPVAPLDRRRAPPAAPLVMDLCNQTNITDGLQGKFSFTARPSALSAARQAIRHRRRRQRPAHQVSPRTHHCDGRPFVTEDQSRISKSTWWAAKRSKSSSRNRSATCFVR